MTQQPDDFTALPLELKNLINGVCDHFELALRTGQQLRVDLCLGAVNEPVRSLLARELLVLECEHALRTGQGLDPGELQARFGVADSVLANCLREARELAGPDLAGGRGVEGPAPGHITFGRFRALRRLGSGAFATVYLAHDPRSGAEVAVKVPHQPTLFSEATRDRFLKEARAVEALNHLNLAQLLEAAEDGPCCYIVTEYVPGESLATWAQRQAQSGHAAPPEQAAELTRTLAAAIHHAHERGVVHCDLTPNNVLLREGRPDSPVITDFGLARLLAEQTHSLSGEVVGTPPYMAPEQAMGLRRQTSPATDVYALGAILYYLLVGEPPFVGESAVEVLHRVMTEEPARPRARRRGVPAALEAICLQCLEKRPQRRYPSAAALADDLGRWQRGEPVQARRVGPLGRAWRWARRRPVAASLTALLALAVAGGTGASLVLWRRAAGSEGRALASLRQEAAARREAEEHFATVRGLLANNLRASDRLSQTGKNADGFPGAMLADAESSLSRLLQKRPDDMALHALAASVLTKRGVLAGDPGGLGYLERAARHWERFPASWPLGRDERGARASTYFHLGIAHARRGNHRQALEALDKALRLVKEFADERPGHYREAVVSAVETIGRVLVNRGCTKEELVRQITGYGFRPEVLGGQRRAEQVLEVLLALRLGRAAEEHLRAGQREAGLAKAREAMAIVGRYLVHGPLDQEAALRIADPTLVVTLALRRGGAAEESLRLGRRLTEALARMAATSPPEPILFSVLSNSWYWTAKAYWRLGRREATLTACRGAVTAQRQACSLAPSVPAHRVRLGWRYTQLGRKLCELGRLDEAERCFRERQALWPGDAAKHAEALRELRKWADQVGDDGRELSPEEQRERQRYLALCARLEQNRAGPAPAAGAGVP